MSSFHPLVRLLEVDPDLASSLTRRQMTLAAQLIVTELRHFEPEKSYSLESIWGPRSGQEIALFIVQGHVARRLRAHQSVFIEILGAGDVVSPWSDSEGVAIEAEMLIPLTHTQITMLDQPVFDQAARWPSITANLLLRACERSRRLSFQLAATHMIGVERRLLAILWHFAHRWGNVNGDGVKLSLPLSNEVLRNVIGSSGPSVSTAIGSLKRQGLAERVREGWLLRGKPPDADEKLGCEC